MINIDFQQVFNILILLACMRGAYISKKNGDLFYYTLFVFVVGIYTAPLLNNFIKWLTNIVNSLLV